MLRAHPLFTPRQHAIAHGRCIGLLSLALVNACSSDVSPVNHSDGTQLPHPDAGSRADAETERRSADASTAASSEEASDPCNANRDDDQCEDAGSSNTEANPADPKARIWEPIPTSVQVRQVPEGYKVTPTLPKDDAPVAVYGALAALEQVRVLQGLAPNTRFREALPGLSQAAAKAREAWRKDIPAPKGGKVPVKKGRAPADGYWVGGSKKPEEYLAEAMRNLEALGPSIFEAGKVIENLLPGKKKKK